MYGSIFRMRPKPGETDAITAEMDRWARERGSNVDGYVSSYVLEAADGDILGIAVFESEEAYRANASDPDQDRWYRDMRSHLVSDPEWNDGTIRQWTAA